MSKKQTAVEWLIEQIQKRINKAIEEEDYETAEKLQKKIIDQLLK